MGVAVCRNEVWETQPRRKWRRGLVGDLSVAVRTLRAASSEGRRARQRPAAVLNDSGVHLNSRSRSLKASSATSAFVESTGIGLTPALASRLTAAWA